MQILLVASFNLKHYNKRVVIEWCGYQKCEKYSIFDIGTENAIARNQKGRIFMVHLCIALVILGIIFLLLEMWLPGAEFFAIIGLVALAVSAVLAVIFVPNGWLIVASQVVIVAGFFRYMYRFMKRKQLKGKLILSDTLESPPVEDLSRFVGQVGRTVTLLKPFGEVEFNGSRVQAASNGPMIEKNTKVHVIEAHTNKIIVRAVEEAFNAN